jgi:hypothetical protein
VEKTWGISGCKGYGSSHGAGTSALRLSLNADMDNLAQALVTLEGGYDNAWVDELDE